MVRAVLDKLSTDIAACKTLAFTDLSTKMVLMTNSDTDMSQNKLNDLCGRAAPVLANGPIAISSDGDQTEIYIRSASTPSEALLCVTSAGVDMSKFIDAAKACLAEISDEEGAE